MRRFRYILLLLLLAATAHAGRWTTHYAYNNVIQIAMAPERVYAVSDGSLFSVDKQTEQIRVYNRQSGLHGINITCILYDEAGEQLLIAYEYGKIDVLSARGVKYVGELYNKDMTQRKTIYNITIHGRTAYLSTHYGIQTMDLREQKLVDTYWLRPDGQETPVKDIVIQSDSIYAFTDDSLYCARLSDPLEDYRTWRHEPLGRIARDEEKGIHYQDATNHWYVGHAEGIVRFTQTDRLTYKPQGPLENKPYRMTAYNGMLYVVPGGRWDTQYNTPGFLMRYDGQNWLNITSDAIRARTGKNVLDFVNVAVDPADAHHCFVTSYGTGLYEFRDDSLLSHTSANGVIHAAIPSNPDNYTRLDNAVYDGDGRLWLTVAHTVPYQLAVLDNTGEWHGIALTANDVQWAMATPGGLVIDKTRPQRKWIAGARKPTGLCLMDDNGTPYDASDDRTVVRDEWTNQHGHSFKPSSILGITQDSHGRLWLMTGQGAAYIDPDTDFFTSDALIQPDIVDENGENPIGSQQFQAMVEDAEGRLWLGSQGYGVYLLNAEADTLVAHYTSDNTALSSNAILSLAYDASTEHVFVGTGDGLVEYDPNGTDDGLPATQTDDEGRELGQMMQWRLHHAYTNPTEVAGNRETIYALADGGVFSVDRATEEITVWNKTNGLTGETAVHIAYDKATHQLLIAYSDGRIDLLEDDGTVHSMPELMMKASSMAVDIQAVCVGGRYTYLGMPFGIVAVNMRKAEVAETYYIGSNASDVSVEQLALLGDSLYAFTSDELFVASINDPLEDYSVWHRRWLPQTGTPQVATCYDRIYLLQQNQLYRLQDGGWLPITTHPTQWMHSSNHQLLVYQEGYGLFLLAEDDQTSGLTGSYQPQDAIYSEGQYWLAVSGRGLVRLSAEGDQFYQPEGPINNIGYRLFAANDRIYVAPGGRWAENYGRLADLSIYDGTGWRGIPWHETYQKLTVDMRDAVSFAVDEQDPGHFFVATYGTGVFEFRDYQAVNHYDSLNSTLRRVNAQVSNTYFTRTDGATMDAEGNLWVLNATSIGAPLHVRNPYGQWKALKLYSQGAAIELNTPGAIYIDQRNSNRKWIIDQRQTQGLILLDDGGTPMNSGDDRCIKRNTWIDQENGNTLTPNNIMCVAQDAQDRLWVGTSAGILLIPSDIDFFSSNACRRIIIPRNDGTNLGDYLLGNEKINCIVPDGGNRIWIGTENSGLYLIEDDTITVAHFTTDNSLLPSNNIQSIAIMPNTGEVFVGTANGIASYRSDASAPQETLEHAYAFPNPVRQNYGGVISIAGLMENTTVNIIDEQGNLVCKTRSHGGIAVWDGNNQYGKRAQSGVYTALCNEPNGAHTVVKILFIH